MEKQVALGSLEREAETFLSRLEAGGNATIVGLYGELGSGKTTFVQCVSRILGVTEPVTSPTFVIMKVYKLPTTNYKLFNHLVHIDAYRLESPDELLHLGWREIVENRKNLIFVEWADRVEDVLPSGTVRFTFEVIGEKERKLTIN